VVYVCPFQNNYNKELPCKEEEEKKEDEKKDAKRD
jgi:hypothetical protein